MSEAPRSARSRLDYVDASALLLLWMAVQSMLRVAPRGLGRAHLTLAVLGGLSILPPYLGPVIGLELDVQAKLEVVDHVVPGVVVVVCGVLAALLARRGGEGAYGEHMLGLSGLCFLAGLWQAVTHAPLVLDGGRPETPWDSVVLHSTAGPVIVVLALWLVLRTPVDAGADVRASG